MCWSMGAYMQKAQKFDYFNVARHCVRRALLGADPAAWQYDPIIRLIDCWWLRRA